jgi:serine/threonine protein kinase
MASERQRPFGQRHTQQKPDGGSCYQCKHLLQIILGRLLGKGMFGQTYLGCWRGGDLAVKCVRVSKESEAASFLREVAALAAIRHPNVMQFYGELAQ